MALTSLSIMPFSDSPHNALEPSNLVFVLDFNNFFLVKGVTIGFEEESVQANENIGVKTICVSVSRGQLGCTTTVSVSSQDQTAIGEYTTK